MSEVRTTIAMHHESDVARARRAARDAGAAAGLAAMAIAELVLAVSEVARNVVMHAGHGVVDVAIVRHGDRRGVEVVARGDGPGIADPDRAMEDGFTTGSGLGLGLPSARRMVDELAIETGPGAGTAVTLRKWGATREAR